MTPQSQRITNQGAHHGTRYALHASPPPAHTTMGIPCLGKWQVESLYCGFYVFRPIIAAHGKDGGRLQVASRPFIGYKGDKAWPPQTINNHAKPFL